MNNKIKPRLRAPFRYEPPTGQKARDALLSTYLQEKFLGEAIRIAEARWMERARRIGVCFEARGSYADYSESYASAPAADTIEEAEQAFAEFEKEHSARQAALSKAERVKAAASRKRELEIELREAARAAAAELESITDEDKEILASVDADEDEDESVEVDDDESEEAAE